MQISISTPIVTTKDYESDTFLDRLSSFFTCCCSINETIPPPKEYKIARESYDAADSFLKRITSLFTDAVKTKKKNELVTLLYTRAGTFKIQTIPYAKIDASFFTAQKLTDEKLQLVLLKSQLSQAVSLKTLLVQEFAQAFIHENRRIEPSSTDYYQNVLNTISARKKRKWSEFGVKLFIRSANNLNDLCELSSSKSIGKIDLQVVKNAFPNIVIPPISFYRIGNPCLTIDPICEWVPLYIEATETKTLKSAVQSLALKNSFIFLKQHPKVYFDELYRRMNTYNNPEEMIEAMKVCQYIDLEKLYSLEILQNLSPHEQITRILDFFPNVSTISIGKNCPEDILKKCLPDLLNQSNSIHTLDFSHSNITDELLQSISQRVKNSKIRSINLSYTEITGASLKERLFEEVVDLTLTYCQKLTDDNLKFLCAKQLKSLNLEYTAINGSCFSSDVFKPLKKLNLTWCSNLLEQNFFILSCDELESIKLCFTKINGSGLKASVFKPVQDLDLRFCVVLNDEHVEFLSSSNLKFISMESTNIYGTSLKGIAFKKAETVNLGHCGRIKDNALKNASFENIKHLNLCRTGIDGEIFTAPFIKKLETLDIKECLYLKPRHIDQLKKLAIRTKMSN